MQEPIPAYHYQYCWVYYGKLNTILKNNTNNGMFHIVTFTAQRVNYLER